MVACVCRPEVTTRRGPCCRWPSTPNGAPTSVRDIRGRTGLPQPYLEQILLALKGAGLVRSKRGVGVATSSPDRPGDILLSEIVSAVDGPISLGDFGESHQGGACDHEGQCVLLAIWDTVGRQVRHHLESYNLADLASMSRAELPWPSLQPD